MGNYTDFVRQLRFGSLDGLRALSIIAVLWHHSGVGTTAFGDGHFGVHLFFAISGFLICSLMIREKMQHGRISLRAFYVRRSLRIIPLYYLVLLVYIAVVALMEQGHDREEFFHNLPAFVTYTSNWFVELEPGERVIFYFAWSLAAEEQFYLTWPWVERYAPEHLKRVALGCLIGLVAATHFGLLFWLLPEGTIAETILSSVPPCILFGVALAHLTHTPQGFSLMRAVLGQRWSAPAVLMAAILAIVFTEFDYLVYVCLALLVVSCTIREDNGLAQLLGTRPLVRLGVVSYGIYLMHMLGFSVAERVGPAVGIDNRWVLWAVGCLLAYGAAELSYRTFERFFLSLKERARTTTDEGGIGVSYARPLTGESRKRD